MLTQADETTLMKHGARMRAEHLVQQAGYTLGVAHADGAPLWELLVPGYHHAVSEAMKTLELRRHDKTFATEESRLATATQNECVADAKVWRRKASARAKRATRMGKAMPDKLIRIGSASSVQQLLGQVKEMADLLEIHAGDLPGRVRPLIEQGRAIADKLGSADADQEVKRLAELPQAVRAYYADKGRLYLALKAINDAGHELHASDSHRSSRYNLAILHRRKPKRAAREELSELGEAMPTEGSTEACS